MRLDRLSRLSIAHSADLDCSRVSAEKGGYVTQTLYEARRWVIGWIEFMRTLKLPCRECQPLVDANSTLLDSVQWATGKWTISESLRLSSGGYIAESSVSIGGQIKAGWDRGAVVLQVTLSRRG